jgi:DNA polymerase III epsilon subunit family exonuclease
MLLILIVLGIIFYAYKDRRINNDLDLLPTQFVVFDLETTGLDATKHEIIEIGALRVFRESTTPQTFQALVRPQANISKKIVELTGITQEMLDRDGKPLADALAGFAAFVGDAGLVSFNASFNMEFLNAAATGCNVTPLNNRVSCALKMARKAWPNRKSYRLVDIVKDENLDADGTHRAFKDCEHILAVYEAAAFKLKSVG